MAALCAAPVAAQARSQPSLTAARAGARARTTPSRHGPRRVRAGPARAMGAAGKAGATGEGGEVDGGDGVDDGGGDGGGGVTTTTLGGVRAARDALSAEEAALAAAGAALAAPGRGKATNSAELVRPAKVPEATGGSPPVARPHRGGGAAEGDRLILDRLLTGLRGPRWREGVRAAELALGRDGGAIALRAFGEDGVSRLCFAALRRARRERALEAVIRVDARMRRLPGTFAAHPKTYTQLLAAYSEAGEWKRADTAWREMLSRGVAPDVQCFSALIGAYGSCGELSRAFEAFGDMQARGVTPNNYVCSALVSACGVANEPERANDVLRWMRDNSVVPNAATCSAYVSTWAGASGDWRKAQAAFQRARRLRADIAEAAGRPPLERVLDSPDAHNALLAAYASSGQVERALRAVMAMQRAGPPPDVATYGAVVAACLKTNQWDRALGVVEALVSGTGVTPNEAIFNSLLKTAAEAGDKATARIDDVRELMLRWQEQSARRDRAARADAASIGGDDGEGDGGVAAAAAAAALRAEAARRRGAEAQRIAAISKAASDGNFGRIANLLLRPTRAGSKPGSERNAPSEPLPIQVYSVVLRACVTHGEGGFACELLRHLRSTYPDLLDTQAYNLAIRACGVSADWEMAVEIFDEMKDDMRERAAALCDGREGGPDAVAGATGAAALRPDAYTFNSLLYALAAGGQPAMAEEVISEMVDAGVTVSDYAASALITAHANGSKGARNALEAARRMAEMGAGESVHTFNAVIRACAKHAEWEKAIYIYNKMQQRGIEPNEYSHKLILRVAKAGVVATESAQLTAALASAAMSAAGALGVVYGLL